MLRALLSRFSPERIADALAAAQAALLAISNDLQRADPQARGYADMVAAAERGFERLLEIASALLTSAPKSKEGKRL